MYVTLLVSVWLPIYQWPMKWPGRYLSLHFRHRSGTVQVICQFNVYYKYLTCFFHYASLSKTEFSTVKSPIDAAKHSNTIQLFLNCLNEKKKQSSFKSRSWCPLSRPYLYCYRIRYIVVSDRI
jgi:hypothetical protein